ncbi:MAG: type II toxin-antitoxin system RelE/ParE family toxin [Desulfarculales bacterium]|jgi:mRNA interferase RelE/StbE|nr:type II toxin-antitoxin system RelE/ParE family toxin [Desulfarculales bacterium]
MSWKIEFTPEAKTDLSKIDSVNAKRILKFLHNRLQKMDNPRKIDESLKGALREFWRYRVGDYRIICRVEDQIITVFVVTVGHRREVYKRPAT